MCLHTLLSKRSGKLGQGCSRIESLASIRQGGACKWTHPNESFEELENLRNDAESLLQKLELPYRVLLICSGDIGFPLKQYDLGSGRQDRKDGSKFQVAVTLLTFSKTRKYQISRGWQPKPVHTLNGSALAIPRVLAAILENNLQQDGTVKVPKCLRKWFPKEIIGSPKR